MHYDYVVCHASFGHPFEHWYAWLFNKLREQGKNVLVPQFPCSIESQAPAGLDMQSYYSWSKVLDAYGQYLSDETSYIGHSIGPAFICSYLSNRNKRAKNLFLVAPVFGEINAPIYNHVNSTFFNSVNWKSLVNLTQKRKCYISLTDPYVPNVLSETFANIISAEKTYCKAGHFNTAAGYTTFEQLFDDIIASE